MMLESRYPLPSHSKCYEKKEQGCKRQVLFMVRQRWTRWWEVESYPAFVIQSCHIEGELLVIPYRCRWKKKKWWRSKEEAKKRIEGEVDSCIIAKIGVWTFSWHGKFVSFWKLIGFELQFFCKELPNFSELRQITCLQMAHRKRCCLYLPKNTKNESFPCCLRPLTLHKVSNKRRIGVPSKTAISARKSDISGLIR
jgi:hypothetical protein